jgi:hypothetical protein
MSYLRLNKIDSPRPAVHENIILFGETTCIRDFRSTSPNALSCDQEIVKRSLLVDSILYGTTIPAESVKESSVKFSSINSSDTSDFSALIQVPMKGISPAHAVDVISIADNKRFKKSFMPEIYIVYFCDGMLGAAG